jgi:hypothetical protein
MGDIMPLLTPQNWKKIPQFDLFVPQSLNIIYEKPLENMRVYATYKELYPGC